MISFGGTFQEHYADEYSVATAGEGGLLPMTLNEERALMHGGDGGNDDEDDAELERPQPMDLEEKAPAGDKDPEGGIFQPTPRFVHPMPAPRIEYDGRGTTFRFRVQDIPRTMPRILPNVMLGLSSINDITATCKTLIAIQPCLPLPVHSSPALALLIATVKDTRKPRDNDAPLPTKVRCVNWALSCFQLQQFRVGCLGGVFPVHASCAENDTVNVAEAAYQAQVALMVERYYEELDTILKDRASGSVDERGSIERFATLLERNSYEYIHHLERFLYTCLIEPHTTPERALPLEAVLTPTNCRFALADANNPRQCRKLAIEFFECKAAAVQKRIEKCTDRAEAHAAAAATAIRTTELSSRITADDGARVRFGCPPEQVWNGYVTTDTLREYLRFSDIDGVLLQTHGSTTN